MISLEEAERRRLAIMDELKMIVTAHNAHGFFSTARRFQRALIELANCAPITPFARANGEKTGSRKKS